MTLFFPAVKRSRIGLKECHAAVLALGALLWWLSEEKPARLPFWMPWEFSWVEYLALMLPALWFLRGLALTPPEKRPSGWRVAAFLTGLAGIYAVLLTHYDYMAQHMFFFNRIQHVVMHHLGPFLIALAGAGETIARGMPAPVLRAARGRAVRAVLNAVQRPIVAALLFSGLFYVWLIPAVHFRAMLDARLYALMNWSMAIDGILFWTLALDLRPKPPARLSFGARIGLTVAVILPQIVLGALLAFARRDLYPSYALCGRLYPSIGAIDDQNIGGIIIWIPPAMMSIVGALLLINAVRLNENDNPPGDAHAIPSAIQAARWTGR